MSYKGYKLCKDCLEVKSISEFGKASTDNSFRSNAGHTQSYCRQCNAARAREWRKQHKNYRGSGKIKKYSEEDRLLISAIGSRLTDAKSRIKKYNQPATDLDRDYLFDIWKQQNGLCNLSGEAMCLEKGTPHTLSLDKIIPNKGYIRGNVQWLAWGVNRAKGDMLTDVFLDMCQKITVKCNDYPTRE